MASHGTSMRIQIQLRIVADDDSVISEDEFLHLDKSDDRLEAIGLSLGEAKALLAGIQERGDRQELGGQAAMARSEAGSASVLNSWPSPEPSLPLTTAPRTWSRRSAPRRDQRICCSLFMRRLTRKLAVPSVIEVPTR